MSKYPLFSSEVELRKINFSTINYSNNKEFFYISYGDSNDTLYLQSPTFKFIQPIIQNDGKTHQFNELYLFLNPQDKSTYDFIELTNNLEEKSQNTINLYKNNISIIPIIKSCDIEEDTDNKNTQIIKYLKVKLLDITQIEHNKRQISIDELNDMVDRVNLKMIFEISMAWISKDNMGIYLKPIKIRAIDLPKITQIDFREDSDSDITHMEQTENIKQIINSQSIMSLNDSAFKTKYVPVNVTSKKMPNLNVTNTTTTTTENMPLHNTFIPSQGYNNIETQLKNELNIMESKREKSKRSKSISNNGSNKLYSHFTQTQYENNETNDKNKTSDNSDSISSESISNNDLITNDILSSNNMDDNSSETSSDENQKIYGRKKKTTEQKQNQTKTKPKTTEPNETKLNETKLNKIKQNKTKLNKTKLNKTKPKQYKKEESDKTDSLIKLRELIDSEDDDRNNDQIYQSDTESLNFELEY
jgi:hypothetical protein